MEENNVLDQLGIEVETKNETTAPPGAKATESGNNGAENTLETFAYAILFIGILASLICLFTICTTEKHGYYSDRTEFNPIGFAVTIATLISSLLSWAFIKVFVNISRTLKEINAKLTKD